VIALVINEMKKKDKITSIPLQNHLDELILLNKTVGEEAGSSKREYLLPRIYRKWKDALPDLGKAPLFKIVGRKKRYDDLMDKVYVFREEEKDCWANLFEYMGSYENVRLKFAIDKLSVSLEDVAIVYGDSLGLSDADAWESFTRHLKQGQEDQPGSEPVNHQIFADKPIPEPEDRRVVIKTRPNNLIRFAVVGVIATLIAFVFWQYNISVEKTALPLPQKPSIAVLAFDNMTGEKEQEYFSDGITETLISSLAKIENIFVISKNSTFTYKGKPKNIKEIAKELNVGYVLEGSVQKAGNTIRITAQLIDGKTNHHVWADTFDGDGAMDEVFKLQDQVTEKIVAALELKLSPREKEKLAEKGTQNLKAYDAYLRGVDHMRRFTPDDYVKAIEYFKQATELDSDYSHAYATLAYLYRKAIFGGKNFWDAIDKDYFTCRLLSLHYLELSMKKPTSKTYQVMADRELYKRNFKKALDFAKKAVNISPNDSDALYEYGRVLVYYGKPEKAITQYKKAIMLDPLHKSTGGIGFAYFTMGDYEQAVKYIEKSLKDYPETYGIRALLSSSYAFLGNNIKAKKAWDEFNTSGCLVLEAQSLYYYVPYKNSEVFERYLEGLIKAGFKGDSSNYSKVQKDQKLSQQEIEKLVTEKILSGFNGGFLWSLSHSQDGTSVFSLSKGGEISIKANGKTWVEGDSICYQYENLYDGLKFCGDVYFNPVGKQDNKSEYFMLTDFLLLPFSINQNDF
ncbi:MAG: tetratricopeptide repeat protein, partial [Desulfobacteraceae bacterium]|nr:tetratricopeptide repeat protein [Desulfobacteraceae bacterium]